MRPIRRSITAVLSLVTMLGLVGWAPPGRAGVPMSPQRRGSFGLAPDATGNIVLFGGDQLDFYGNVRTWFGDTWTWDGTAWTEQHPASSPEPRCCFAMAFDSVRGQTVVFGGYDGTTYLNDTWTWDGTNWTEQHPTTVPDAQYGPGMAFDERRGQIVLLSGSTYGPYKSLTWTWDGTDWTQQSPVKSPPYRERMAMAYDGARDQVMVFGGEYPVFEWESYLNDTWSWMWTKWGWHNPDVKPSRRSMMAMTYDAGLRNVVMFGDGAGSDDATWLWDGQTWARAHPLTSPPTRWSEGMTWDPVRGQVVMFGGRTYGSGYEDFRDTWIWDGADWQCVLSCSP